MEYTGPAALNEGIKAIGEAFTSRPAISLQDLMQRKQLEQAMKPITLDELKAKTPPDLYEPMMKLAGSNGLIENVNGIQFIRQHNVKDFHKTLSENKVWQQMILDDSIKNSNALIEQRLPELEQRKAKHEARLRYWDDQRKKAMATTDAKGNQMAPNMKAIDSIDREMAEYQQGDEYKQMMSLEKQLMGIKELQKRRLQSFGINEDGFKKDTETYGSDEALKIAIYGTNYRRQLDRQLKEEKLQDEITLETAKAGLKPDEKWSDPYIDTIGGKKVMVRKNLVTNKVEKVGEDKSTTVVVNPESSPVQQTQFVDPQTGVPLVFDKKTGTYRQGTVTGNGVAPRPTNPSSTEREKTAQYNVIRDQIKRIKSSFNPNYVGVISGQAGRLTELMDSKEASFRQVILDVKDSLLRARSGAQINEQEYARLSKLVPDFTDSIAQFRGKMKSFETTFESIAKEREKAQRSGGVYLRGTPKKVGRFTVEAE